MPKKLVPNTRLTHAYITDAHGQSIIPTNLKTSQVRLDVIAHSLARQVRYLGHVKDFYSVAEHSVLVSCLAEAAGEDETTVRAAFLHDAHEAYVGDFPSPFKAMVPDLVDFERHIETVVREALNLPGPQDAVWDVVKHYDILALHYEAHLLFKRTPAWAQYDIAKMAENLMPARTLITGEPYHRAEAMFRKRMLDLGLAVR